MKKVPLFILIAFSIGMFTTGAWAASQFSDVPFEHWASQAINNVQLEGLMKGDENKNTFRPNDPITRAETAVVLNRMDDYMKEYVQEYVNEQVQSSISAFEKVIKSPIYEAKVKNNLEGLTEFKSEKLGIGFKIPDYLKDCKELEVILDELPPFEEIQQKGRKIGVDCGDLRLSARTKIYTPYEDHYIGYALMPEPYQMQDGCLFLPNEGCLGYRLELENGHELYLVIFQWDGGDYYVGTYLPIEGNQYYKSVRIVTKIKENNQGLGEHKNIQKDIVDRNLDADSLKKLEDFEQIILSAHSV